MNINSLSGANSNNVLISENKNAKKKLDNNDKKISNIISELKKDPDNEAKKDELKKACKEFESIFIFQLIKSMRKTVEKNGLIDGGKGEEIFQSMLDQRYAEKMGETEELGLANELYKQLSRRYK